MLITLQFCAFESIEVCVLHAPGFTYQLRRLLTKITGLQKKKREIDFLNVHDIDVRSLVIINCQAIKSQCQLYATMTAFTRSRKKKRIFLIERCKVHTS